MNEWQIVEKPTETSNDRIWVQSTGGAPTTKPSVSSHRYFLFDRLTEQPEFAGADN